MLRNFWNDEQGATAIEYGLIAALIAIAIIGSVRQVGIQTQVPFETVASTLDSNIP